MRKQLHGALCMALALLILAGAAPSAEAADKALSDEPEELHICSAEDLNALALNCSLDTWSDNVRVVLDNDISLAGSDFSSIPVFNGVFDGSGHTIYGLDLTAAQSPCGLFLETGEDADICDLNVSGTVAPGDSDDMVGGLVGRNRGAITNCSFNGRVLGRSQIGGLVGKNEASGLLTGCSATGSVQGISMVGGVAGLNEGTLLICNNKSYVNTQVVDPALRLDQIDTSSLVNLYRSITTDTADIVTNIGGVAGDNRGFAEQCGNGGIVGYLHVGYNVGGIAGRSSGGVNGCSNSAEVYGRRNVGGIVGRAEPMVEISQAENLIAGLGYRMSALNRSIEDAAKHAGEDTGDLVNHLSGLSKHFDPVRRAIASINITDPESFDPSAFAGLRSALATAVTGVSKELRGISSQVDKNNKELMRDMDKVSYNLNALSGTALETVNLLSGAEKHDDILTDDSAEMADSIILGKNSGSENEGSIYGDSNVGGIVGAQTLEEETGLDDVTGGKDNSLIQNRYSLRAVITECINRGTVTAKRECAGGICGRLDLGLIANCAAYGHTALEDGEYAGGICGLSYSTIKNCCAKCTLDGSRYIGGVLGNGNNAANSEEQPSMVSGCYTLVDIQGKPQYSGAVSGGGAGEYENNYFVPAGFAGMDKLSIHGHAEPISFDDFAAVEGMPEECCSFTLTFVVDGQVVKSVPFSYGDSFDRSEFPEVKDRDGSYPVWDRTDLTDLRYDTVVSAEYRTDKTVIASDLVREDARSAVIVEGRFQEGDTVKAEPLPLEGESTDLFQPPWQETLREQLKTLLAGKKVDYSICTAVTEKLRISFSDDGQTEHTVRLLAPDGSVKNHRVYLQTDRGWELIPAGAFGSYLTFTAPGTDLTLILTDTIQSWWIAALAAAALLLFVLLIRLIVVLRRIRRARAKASDTPRPAGAKRNRTRGRRIAAAVLACLILAAAVFAGVRICTGRLGMSIAAERTLRSFAQTETDIKMDVSVSTPEREFPVSTTVHRVSADGKMITCVDGFDIPLYISEGKVYLESGRAFRITDSRMNQELLIDTTREVFLHGDLKKEKLPEGTVYTATLGDSTAEQILESLTGGVCRGSVKAENIRAAMTVQNGTLTELSVSGEGTAENGLPVSVKAELKPEPISVRPSIPNAVLTAVSKNEEASEYLTEDIITLFSAWLKYDNAPNADALLTARADGGILNIRTDCDYFRERIGETDIHCVSSPLFTVYFTGSAACDENGQTLIQEENDLADAAGLVGIARELFQKGTCSCEHLGDTKKYSISLDAENAKALAETLLPALKETAITYGDTVLSISVENDELSSISFRSEGSVKIVTRAVDVVAEVTLRFTDTQTHSIPAAVQESLLGVSDNQ